MCRSIATLEEIILDCGFVHFDVPTDGASSTYVVMAALTQPTISWMISGLFAADGLKVPEAADDVRRSVGCGRRVRRSWCL
jgi:hypothetical protein